jgi:hypothetical protein
MILMTVGSGHVMNAEISYYAILLMHTHICDTDIHTDMYRLAI